MLSLMHDGLVAPLFRHVDRRRLVEIFEEVHESVVYCLRAAVVAGELSSAYCDELAHFLYASLRGAILRSKAEGTSVPMKRFKKLLFSTVLR